MVTHISTQPHHYPSLPPPLPPYLKKDSYGLINETFDEFLVKEPSKERIIKIVLEDFDAIKANQIKNLEGMEMKILMLNGKTRFYRLRNTLYELKWMK